MVRNKIVINDFQKHQTIFNQRTGFQLRIEKTKGENLVWNEFGPELIDISITNWCDQSCIFCYKNSNSFGKNIEIGDLQIILEQARKMKVLQIALGGGNPNQHPQFIEILRMIRQDYDIVPSYTTNGRGLTEEILEATHNYCGAVAVSAYRPYIELKQSIKKFSDKGIRTNIHFLLTSESVQTAINWLTNPPDFFERINAIIFLNYKPVGNNPNLGLLANKSLSLQKFFTLVNKKHKFKIGFDSCSISGVAQYLSISPIFIDSCEAGRFSLYISEDSKMYPCSFLINKLEGVQITDNNIQSTWQNNPSFIAMRNELPSSNCKNCTSYEICNGGCSLFPEINICK